jgi:hypothetical protein
MIPGQQSAACRGEITMSQWEVKMGRAGGGSPTFVIRVYAGTPDMARASAEAQNPGYKAQSVRRV